LNGSAWAGAARELAGAGGAAAGAAGGSPPASARQSGVVDQSIPTLIGAGLRIGAAGFSFASAAGAGSGGFGAGLATGVEIDFTTAGAVAGSPRTHKVPRLVAGSGSSKPSGPSSGWASV